MHRVKCSEKTFLLKIVVVGRVPENPKNRPKFQKPEPNRNRNSQTEPNRKRNFANRPTTILYQMQFFGVQSIFAENIFRKIFFRNTSAGFVQSIQVTFNELNAGRGVGRGVSVIPTHQRKIQFKIFIWIRNYISSFLKFRTQRRVS